VKVTGFNQLSIGTTNLAETVKLYQTVLGMKAIPSDRGRIPEMKLPAEFAEQDQEGLAASLYLDRPRLKTASAR
jgi:catechol 2,3-dioxygenase-like lactoylglutathione lyase family enzyme